LHFRVVAVDVLAREPKELIVVCSLEMVAARTLDCSDGSSFTGSLVR